MRHTSKAAKLLHELAERAERTVICAPRHFDVTPGAFIKRLPEEQRETLRELRSEDVVDFRVPSYW